jgi:hypothetical protein
MHIKMLEQASVTTHLGSGRHYYVEHSIMSDKPEERNKDSRKAAEGSIEQAPPIDKQDPTQPVTVEDNATAAAGQGGQKAGRPSSSSAATGGGSAV